MPHRISLLQDCHILGRVCSVCELRLFNTHIAETHYVPVINKFLIMRRGHMERGGILPPDFSLLFFLEADCTYVVFLETLMFVSVTKVFFQEGNCNHLVLLAIMYVGMSVISRKCNRANLGESFRKHHLNHLSHSTWCLHDDDDDASEL